MRNIDEKHRGQREAFLFVVVALALRKRNYPPPRSERETERKTQGEEGRGRLPGKIFSSQLHLVFENRAEKLLRARGSPGRSPFVAHVIALELAVRPGKSIIHVWNSRLLRTKVLIKLFVGVITIEAVKNVLEGLEIARVVSVASMVGVPGLVKVLVHTKGSALTVELHGCGDSHPCFRDACSATGDRPCREEPRR